MNARIIIFLVLGIISSTRGQNTIDLTFTAADNTAYIRLDSIKVMNRTQGDSVKLYWPDTTLTYQITPGDLLLFIGYAMDSPVGMQSNNNREHQFKLIRGYPNPVRDQTIISMFLPLKGLVDITVSDIRNRVVVNIDRELTKGLHSFRFSPGDERFYILTARWNGITQSMKIISEGLTSGKPCKLDYIGIENENPVVKQSQVATNVVVQESGILDSPATNETYMFEFATNIPCPGTPTVTYDGQVYNTIQIFSQCWFKENLNIGTMINGAQNQSNNSLIEKYCYQNVLEFCTQYGGLYQWNEMMQYTTQQGVQGICPQGWHLPTDEEWKVLEGAVDSHYRIGDPEWDLFSNGPRGYDAGKNLKTTNGWYGGENGTNQFGFSALPGGYRSYDGLSYLIGGNGLWWTSSEYGVSHTWDRYLISNIHDVNRNLIIKEYGFSVRCLKDL